MNLIAGTLMPIGSLLLAFVYPILLIMGCIICWKRSFKEGVWFFGLLLVHEIYWLYAFNHWEQYATIIKFFSDFLSTIPFLVLLLGIYRRLNQGLRKEK